MKKIILFLLLMPFLANAQLGTITTVAGTIASGFLGDGGPATSARLSAARNVFVDNNGNLYIADYGNNRIRKVDNSGTITSIAGTGGTSCFGLGVPALTVDVHSPVGIATDRFGNIYTSASQNNQVLRIDPFGIIFDFAGMCGVSGTTGDNAPAVLCNFRIPYGVAADRSGNVYISDPPNNRIRMVDRFGMINAYAGTGTRGTAGDAGPAIRADIEGPLYMTYDAIGNMYFTDQGSQVRKINTGGLISTICGRLGAAYSGDGGPASSAQLNNPQGIAADAAGNIYISDYGNNRIRKISEAGIITTIAGGGIVGYSGDGGPASLARISAPVGICTDQLGNLYFNDNTSLVRRILYNRDAPHFVNGHTQSFSVCDTVRFSLDTLLAVTDNDTNQNENWTVLSNPVHGVLAGGYFALSTGGTMYAASVSYTPGIGYSGLDSFTIRVSDGHSCDTTVIYVNVLPLPVAGPISGPASLCAGGFITLAVGDPGGVWSVSNTHASASGGFVVGVTPGIDTVTYVVTNSCGVDTVKQIVTITPLPYADRISGPSTLCPGTSVTLTDTSTHGIWLSTGRHSGISGTGVLSATSAGLDTVYYVVTNSCGTSVAQKEITIYPLPYAGIVTGPTTMCEGSGVVLTDTTLGGTWSVSNGNARIVSLSAGIAVSGLHAGLDTIVYAFTNSCGTDSRQAIITINPLPDAGMATGSLVVCAGSVDSLSDTAHGITWRLSNANATIVPTATGVALTGTHSGADTLYYATTNSCGTDTRHVVITVRPLPFASSLTGSSILCVAATDTLTDTAAGGVWVVSNGNATATMLGTSRMVLTGAHAGFDTVTFFVNNTCGTDTRQKIITINPLPDAGVISGPSVVCVASMDTISETVSGGTWSLSNGNATLATTAHGAIISGLHAGLDTVIYSYTNSCGTDARQTVITVNPLPDAGTITGSAAVCIAATDTLIDTTSGGTWAISNDNATLTTLSSGIAITGAHAGLDTVTYTVTNSCGTDIKRFVATVNPLPDAGTISGLPVVCVASADTLTSTTSGGSWTISNGNATISSGIVTGAHAGLDTVTYTYTNTCGTDTRQAIITVNPLPDAGAISGITAVCVASADTLTDTTSGGTWALSNVNASLTIAGSAIITGSHAGLDTLSYSVINSCGTDTRYAVITVNPLPDAGTIVGSSTVCIAVTDTLTDTVTGGTWSISNANASLAASSAGAVIIGVYAGLDTVTYIYTNSCGTDSRQFVITINPLPDAGSITGLSVVCVSGTDTLSDTTGGGTWSLANGNASLLSLSSSAVLTGIHGGFDTVYYSVTNSCGTDRQPAIVYVNPLPNAGIFTGSPSVCVASVDTLTDTASGGIWTLSNTNATLVPFATGAAITGAHAGLDTVVYTVTNLCGTDTRQATINVNPLPDAGTITGSSAVCLSGFDVLTDSASGGIWSISNGNASLLTTSTGSRLTGLHLGLDTVTYTVTNFCGTDRRQIIISVNPLPFAGSITGLTSLCVASNDTLTDTASGGTWALSNGNATFVTSGSSIAITGAHAGLDTVTYSVTNSCGTDTRQVVITINPLPDAGFTAAASSICIGNNDTLSFATAGGSWTVSNSNATLSSTTAASFLHGVHAGLDTVYYVVTNSCGTDIHQAIIGVNPLPDAGSVTGVTTVCVAGVDTLTDTAGGGVWAVSNSNALLFSLTGSAAIVGAHPGQDTVIYTVTNMCGTDARQVIVTINPLADAGTIAGFNSICTGIIDTLTNTTPGGIWFASNTNVSISGSSSLCSVHGVAAGKDTLIYVVTNSCGTDTAFHTVVINPQPKAGVITGPTAVCAHASIVLKDTTNGGVWTLSNNSAQLKGDTLTGITAGVDSVFYTVANSCGTVHASHAVLINPLPVSGIIEGASNLCLDSVMTLSFTATGGVLSTKNDNLTLATNIVTARKAGMDTILYTVTNGCGISTSSLIVSVDSCAPVILPGTARIYPSPAHDVVTIETPHAGDFDHFAIIAMDGSIITSGVYTSPKMDISMYYLPTGIYLIKLYGQFGVLSQRVVKE